MKDAILLELAWRWERDAKEPEFLDGPDEATAKNSYNQGRRETLRECADTVRELVSLLGE